MVVTDLIAERGSPWTKADPARSWRSTTQGKERGGGGRRAINYAAAAPCETPPARPATAVAMPQTGPIP
jgi:hypothetical protein